MRFNIADLPCNIENHLSFPVEQIRERYSRFLNLNTNGSKNGGYQFGVSHNGTKVNFDIKSGNAKFHFKRFNMYTFDSLLRMIYSTYLVDKNGFLLHSSGIAAGDKAYVFCGKSGSGKSTIIKRVMSEELGVKSKEKTRNAKRKTRNEKIDILSDEIIAIRKIGNSWKAFGTPFRGEVELNGMNNSYKLNKLFFIYKSKKTSCGILDAKSSLSLLLKNIVFFRKDNEFARNLFDTGCNFVKEVKCYELHICLNDWSLDYILNKPRMNTNIHERIIN